MLLIAHLGLVVSPRPELHVTELIVEGIPGDVNLAGGHEDSRWNVSAFAIAVNQHIGWICAQKQFIGTEKKHKNIK